MRPRRLAALLLGAALLAPAVVGLATASPMPTSVCTPCDRGFEAAAQGHDLDVQIQRSTATVQVHANGSATWTVRNQLSGDDVADLRQNDARLEQVASESIRYRGMAVHDQRLLDVEFAADDMAVLRYRAPNFADQTLGVLRSDYFRDHPGAYLVSDLGADRLTVVAPEGMVVAAGIPGSSVDGREMTLRSFDASGDGPFVVFAPEDATLGGVRAQLAVGLALAPIVGKNLLWMVALPVGVLTAAYAGTSKGIEAVVPVESPTRARWAGGVVGALGVLATVLSFGAPTAIGGIHTSTILRAGGVGTMVVGGVAAWHPTRLGPREQGLLVVAGLAVGTVAALASSTLGAMTASGTAAYTVALPLLSLLGLPLGHVTARGDRRGWLLGLAGIAGLFALLIGLTQPLTDMGGSLYYLGPILLTLLALATAVLAVPLLTLGALLPATS